MAKGFLASLFARGVAVVTIADGGRRLTPSQASCLVLVVQGTTTGSTPITVPDPGEGDTWIVVNQTANPIVLKGPNESGAAVVAGERTILDFDSGAMHRFGGGVGSSFDPHSPGNMGDVAPGTIDAKSLQIHNGDGDVVAGVTTNGAASVTSLVVKNGEVTVGALNADGTGFVGGALTIGGQMSAPDVSTGTLEATSGAHIGGTTVHDGTIDLSAAGEVWHAGLSPAYSQTAEPAAPSTKAGHDWTCIYQSAIAGTSVDSVENGGGGIWKAGNAASRGDSSYSGNGGGFDFQVGDGIGDVAVTEDGTFGISGDFRVRTRSGTVLLTINNYLGIAATARIRANGGMSATLTNYASNALALAGGLVTGDLYQTAGVVMVVT